jgi:uncharacterized repeat protein (TIGR01451 family)
MSANLQFIAATNTPGVVSNAGNTVWFAFGNLTNNAARQATLVARALAPGLVTNTVNLTASPTDAHTNNNRATLITTVRGVANLALGAVASPNSILASSNVTITLSVTNRGPWPASSVILTNLLPAGVTGVSASSSQGPTAIVGGVVTAFLFNLASNGVATVTISYHAGPNPGVVQNLAGVYQNELDPVPANNSVATPITVNPLTDVLIGSSTNVFTGPGLLVGSNFTYRVFVTNNGPSSASSVFVTNVVPPGATYISASATRGVVTQHLGVVTWNVTSLTSLSSNQSANLSVVMRPNIVGTITNSARIVSSAADPIPANNLSTAIGLVAPMADLILTMAAPGAPTIVTSNLVYSLTVSNRGPAFATNVVVVNPLPAQSQFVSAQASQGSASFNGSSVLVNLGQVNASATATISVTLRPLIEGQLTNTATVSAGVFDPLAGNNSAAAVATVASHPDGPILRIARVGSTTNVLLYWTTNSAGFFLESTTNLFAPASWVSNSVVPVIRGTQYHVTNGVTPVPRHYRLRQNPIISPVLSLRLSGTNVLVSWMTNNVGFALQSSGVVAPPAWSYVSNAPAVTAGLYLVSLPNTSTWRFFRLYKGGG